MATAAQLQNLIDGELVGAGDGQTDTILNPATGQTLGHAPSSGPEDVARAVAAARRAFGTYAQTTPAQRQDILLALADIVEAHADEFAQIESADAGKPIEAVKADEIPLIIDQLRFFAGAARTMEGKAAGEYVEGYTSMVRREPIGVIGQVAPWNYPLMMAIWKLGPALATGNTMVLKPAPTTPMSTLRLAELAVDVAPPRRRERHRRRERGRRRARHRRRRRHGRAHGLRRDGQVDRRARGTHAQARPPRARRQRARRRLRRRRPRARLADHRRRRLLQRRAGLRRGHSGARRPEGLRRRRVRPGRAGQGLRDRRPGRRRARRSAR